MKDGDDIGITPGLVLEAYRRELFPMADDAGDERLFWYDPPARGILPIGGLHVPRRLRRTILKTRPYDIVFDGDFEGVIRGCAASTPSRPKTWINRAIIDLYSELFRQGHAHCVEARAGGELVGGVYGLAIGGAFFGESMFSVRRDASKVALVHLVARLWRQGFILFDAQFVNDHIAQFGVYEVPRQEYQRQLALAVAKGAQFLAGGSSAAGSLTGGLGESGPVVPGGTPAGAASCEKGTLRASEVAEFLQSITQTS